VVEITGEGPAVDMLKVSAGKSDFAFEIARMAYDPLYGIPERSEDMSEEHRAARESFFVELLDGHGMLSSQGPAYAAVIAHCYHRKTERREVDNSWCV